ncbi:MAG: hypothetical protein ACAI35_02540 [Candidatus Methylacidiphilales bacterium]|nr:hypothetical protein [Candidatus Methylacidiphilales bacterium]
MSGVRLINVLYLLVLATLAGISAYAYNALQTGNNDDLKGLWDLVQSCMSMPTCGAGNSNNGNGDSEGSFGGFEKQTDQGCLQSNFASCYKMEVPPKIKLVSCHYQHISCQVHLYMYKVEGSYKELKMLAGNMGCARVNSTDKTVDKAAAAFTNILPSGWREMRMYRGVIHHNGYDLRIYLDEANGCAYIAEQQMSNIM